MCMKQFRCEQQGAESEREEMQWMEMTGRRENESDSRNARSVCDLESGANAIPSQLIGEGGLHP